jgi:hypothetical protein
MPLKLQDIVRGIADFITDVPSGISRVMPLPISIMKRIREIFGMVVAELATR